MSISTHDLSIIQLLVDLGPEGGMGGSNIPFQGSTEDLLKVKTNYTAKYLKKYLKS